MRLGLFFPVVFLTLGWFGMEMCMAFDASQFQIILDSHLNNASMIATVLTLGPIAGMTVQPLAGWMGDVLKRHGLSRKFFMVIGLILGAISTMGLAFAKALWVIILLIGLFFLGLNLLIVNYRAIVTEISARKALSHYRGTISGYIGLFSGIGTFAMFTLGAFLTHSPYLFWITTAVLLGTFAVFFRFAPKPKALPVHHEPASDDLFTPWKIIFYAMPFLALFPSLEDKFSVKPHQRQIFRLFVVVFFSWIGIQALRGFFILYVDKVLHLGLSNAHKFLAVIALMMITAAVPLGKLADRLNNVTLLRSALLIFTTVTAVGFMINSWFFCLIISVFMGIAITGLVVFPFSILMKLCPPRVEGSYAGLYNLFISIPQIYSLIITGCLIDMYRDYRVIFPIAAVALLAGSAMTFRMRPLEGPILAKPAPIPEET